MHLLEISVIPARAGIQSCWILSRAQSDERGGPHPKLPNIITLPPLSCHPELDSGST